MNAKSLLTIAVAGAALTLWGCDNYNTNPPTSTGASPAETHTEAAEAYTEQAQEQRQAAQREIENSAERVADQNGVVAQNARPVLDQALADINAGRYDQAEAALDQLEDMDLPDTFDRQVSDARRLLEAQRSAQPQGTDTSNNTGVMGY